MTEATNAIAARCTSVIVGEKPTAAEESGFDAGVEKLLELHDEKPDAAWEEVTVKKALENSREILRRCDKQADARVADALAG